MVEDGARDVPESGGLDGKWERIVVSDQLEVEAELHALGVTRRELMEVLEAAKWGRNSGTEWDPPGFAGWTQYGIGTRSLREVLIEGREKEGARWSKNNEKGLSRTISPEGTLAIVVSSGSPETGDQDKQPKTRNPKGKVSRSAFRTNRSQLELFGSDGDVNDPWLWFLLVYVDGNEVFGELSLPLDVDETGRASEWKKRIIIAPQTRDDHDAMRKDIDDDLDIDITRRTG